MTRTITANLLLLAAIALTAGGCNSSRYDKNAYDFDPERSRTRAILDAQYAKGAAQDAALSPHHFEGTALNGLGRDKIDWIMAYGKRQGRLVVHVDIVGADATSAEPMLQSVRDYLTASGVTVTGDMVVLGPSPRTSNASDTIAGVRRLEQRDNAPDAGSPESNVVANQNSRLFSER